MIHLHTIVSLMYVCMYVTQRTWPPATELLSMRMIARAATRIRAASSAAPVRKLAPDPRAANFECASAPLQTMLHRASAAAARAVATRGAAAARSYQHG